MRGEETLSVVSGGGGHGYKEYKDVLIRNPITQTPNSKLLLVIRQFIRHFYWILKGASMRHKAWS